jgi:hypothetical protein
MEDHMKYLRIFFFISIGIFIFLSPQQLWAMEDPLKQSLNEVLDLAAIKIESKASQEVLKRDFIKVRKKRTDYIPSSEVTIPEFKRVYASYYLLNYT